jgi:hypothetical protein
MAALLAQQRQAALDALRDATGDGRGPGRSTASTAVGSTAQQHGGSASGAMSIVTRAVAAAVDMATSLNLGAERAGSSHTPATARELTQYQKAVEESRKMELLMRTHQEALNAETDAMKDAIPSP